MKLPLRAKQERRQEILVTVGRFQAQGPEPSVGLKVKRMEEKIKKNKEGEKNKIQPTLRDSITKSLKTKSLMTKCLMTKCLNDKMSMTQNV